MARRDPNLTPAGPAEQALYDAVTERFPVLNDFYRAVAARTHYQLASERSAFYRYINGHSVPDGRLEIYADVLGDTDASAFERPATPRTPSQTQFRQMLREELSKLLEPIEQLLQRLADQALQGPRAAEDGDR